MNLAPHWSSFDGGTLFSGHDNSGVLNPQHVTAGGHGIEQTFQTDGSLLQDLRVCGFAATRLCSLILILVGRNLPADNFRFPIGSSPAYVERDQCAININPLPGNN